MGLKNSEIPVGRYRYNHYNYPEELLNSIRALVTNDIKGEIVEDSYKSFALTGVLNEF